MAERIAVADGQAADADVESRINLEHAAGVVAAYSYPFRPRAVDGHAVGDLQFTGQGDGAVQSVREVDCVRAGIGGGDCRPQRAGPAVVEVRHREGAEQSSVLQSLELWQKTPGAL